MTLIRYEAFKILRRRTLWIALAVFIALDLYSLWTNAPVMRESNPNFAFQQGRKAMYARVAGPITDETIAFVLNGWDATKPDETGSAQPEVRDDRYFTKTALGDWTVYDELKTEMERQFVYNQSMEQLRDSARENLAYLDGAPPSFESRRNQRILDTYGGRRVDHFYDLDGFSALFRADFSALLTLLLVLLALVPVFSGERDCGMEDLLSASRLGRRRLILAKQAAGLLVTLGLGVFFLALDVAYFASVVGLPGGETPLYAIKAFRYTPLTCTVWQYLWIQDSMRLLAYLVIGQIVLCLSGLFRETYLAFIVGAGLVGLLIATGTGSAWNPVSLLTYREIAGELAVIDLCSFPVLKAALAPAVITTILIGLFGITFWVCSKRWRLSLSGLVRSRRRRLHA